MSKSKNDEAWEKIFEQDNLFQKIESDNEFIIDSKRINKIRESRLMTKFDSRKDLPKIFKDLNLSILPISRGSYKVGRFNMFHDFEDFDTHKRKDKIFEVEFPSFIKTIDPNKITSEPSALYCADLCHIFNKFTREDKLYSTISGRMGSGNFNFEIQEPNRVFDFEVKGSQIEIDAGYESVSNIYLVEAKNILSKDFVIRQVYYPFRTWHQKALDKDIRNLYLTYSNGIFYVREYIFPDISEPNSITLVRSERYSIVDKKLTLAYLTSLTHIKLPTLDSQGAPFPQADDFNKVINLCEELMNNSNSDNEDDDIENEAGMTKEDITELFNFDKRQADYYSNAAKYLGLVSINRGLVKLTDLGIKVMDLTLAEKQIQLVKLILASPPFRETVKLYLENNGRISLEDVYSVVESCNIENLNKYSSTFHRRCMTVRSWVEWIGSQVRT